MEDSARMGVHLCSLPSTCLQLSGLWIKEAKGASLRSAAYESGFFFTISTVTSQKYSDHEVRIGNDEKQTESQSRFALERPRELSNPDSPDCLD